MAVSSFHQAGETNLASRKAFNKVHLGSILPNKPQIQFKPPPKRKVLRPVKESELTPENLSKLSIDQLMDISGIPLSNDAMISNTSQVKSMRPSVMSRSTNTTSQNGTKKTGKRDSVKSFQVPNVDETMTNQNSKLKRSDGLQVKATGIFKTDGCRSKGLAVPCKLTQNGAKTIDNVSEGHIETEPTDRVPHTNGVMVSPNHLRFPKRLPPIHLQGDNSSSRGKNTKGEQSRAPALKSLLSSKDMAKNRCDKRGNIKRARKQKLEFGGTQAVTKCFTSKQDDGKPSEVTQDEENVSKEQGLFSYNNNGNTDPKGDKALVYECKQEQGFTLEESPPNQDPGASLLQLSPDQLDNMLDIMINMTTEERTTTLTPDPNSTLNGDTQRGSTVARSTPPGFNLIPNSFADFTKTSPGLKPLPQSATGFTLTADMSTVDGSPVQVANASCSFSSNATTAFPQLMMKSSVPPPPGFQPMQIPFEILENITSKKRAKSSSYLANERAVGRGAGDEELHRLGQSYSTPEERDSDDWCYEVQWPDGWRETNRDASYLPADVREQLHIDLGLIEGVTPRQPKLVDQPSNRNDHREASQREHAVPQEETSKSNGNNNHKQTLSNCSKGKTFSIASPSPNAQSEETVSSSSITNRQKESTNSTSTDQTVINLHNASSRYTSDVMISSDSNWSQSTVDWKVDIEELLLLLSGPSDDIKPSVFQSVHTSFPSIRTEQATLCGADWNTSVEHSRRDGEFPPKHAAKSKHHSDPMMCFTLPNGDLELVELSSVSDVEFLCVLTEKEEDSLDKYLSEGKSTDREMDFFWWRDFSRNKNRNFQPSNCETSSILREGKAVRGLQGQDEYDARQELGHGICAAKSVQDHHEENTSSRNGVGRMMHKLQNHSLASRSPPTTHRLKKSKELLTKSSTGHPFPLNDRTCTDSENWRVFVSRESSIPPDATESHASARVQQRSRGTPKQITKELQLRTSAGSCDENAHPRDRPTCKSLQQIGTVDPLCVEDTLQNTYKEGDVSRGADNTEEVNLYPQMDCETQQHPPSITWKPAPKLADVIKENIHPQDIGTDEKCQLLNKEKGMNADNEVSPTIKYKKDALKIAVKEQYASATCSPKTTQEESKVAHWKHPQKQRRHSEAHEQPLAEVEAGPLSTVHGGDSLKQMVKKVELATASSSSSESRYIISSLSQTLSIEERMRINDEQLDHAIQMERIKGGRPAEQVAPSMNTYQSILRWLKKSDFSLIPHKKKAKHS